MVKHIKVLGKCPDHLISSEELIRNFLIGVIKEVDMVPLGEPTVHNVPIDLAKMNKEPFEDEGGITSQLFGYSTLSTSHCAIHSWPARNEFHLDIYSCRFFSKEKIINYLTNTFQPFTMKISDLSFSCKWEEE